MRCSGAWGSLGLSLVAAPVDGQANSPSLGLAMVVVASDPAFGGLGPTAVFPLSAELGVAATAIAGWRGPALVGRGELLLQVQFAARARGARWYGLGGVAGVTGRSGGGFLLLALGLERGRVGCWWGEAGVAGGIRLAGGYRYPIRSTRR